MCWRTRRQSKVWYSLHTAACNHFAAAAAAALAAAAAAEANCFSVVVVVVVVVVVEVVTNPSSLARSPLLRAGSADMVFCIIIYIYMYILSIYIPHVVWALGPEEVPTTYLGTLRGFMWPAGVAVMVSGHRGVMPHFDLPGRVSEVQLETPQVFQLRELKWTNKTTSNCRTELAWLLFTILIYYVILCYFMLFYVILFYTMS